MTTPAARWAQIKQLFDACLDLPGSQRDALIAAAGLSADALADLRSLLVHHEAASAGRVFLVDNAAQTLAEPSVQAAHVGQRLGAWEVVRAIGAGGMGEVFEARRADGTFEGRAAVKVLKRGMDSSAVLQRFALERQALARLSHPHIARLLDAGASGDGLPYFVLEYVDGQPIDEAAKPLPLPQRLALFLQLADAVAHAHRNLLVHRDLKPSNVLVDAQGQVKLLDFGIAKALDPLEGLQQKDSGNTTVAGQRPYTPNYASPEQVRGEPVSTATDIYSLGVLLYQMLTGTRPTGRDASTPAEAARSVLEEAPTRPSRLSAREAVDPQWMNTRKTLAGDLDNILLKALEKTPERRYASVDALAADVRAVIEGRPVSARAASPAYVLGKFLRRNAWAAAAMGLGALGLLSGLAATVLQGRAALALGALGLVGGLGLALVQARKAALARDQALLRFEDVRQLVHAVLFDYHDLIEALPGATRVRQRLVQDALRYLDRLTSAAPPDRALRREIGLAFRVVGVVQRNGYRRPHLGDTAGAFQSYARSIETLEPLVAEDPRDEASAYELALALSARAAVWAEDGDLAAATPPLQRAAALFTANLAPDTREHRNRLELARTHLRLADAQRLNGDANRGLASVQQARAVLDSLAAIEPGHPELPHVWDWVITASVALLHVRRDWPAMQRLLAESWSNLLVMHAREPDNARFQEDLAGVSHWQLYAAGRMQDAAAARHWGLQASERWGAVARSDADNHHARGSHLHALVASGRELCNAGEPAAAVQRLHEVRPLLDAALQRWPNLADVCVRELLWLSALALSQHGSSDTLAAQQTMLQAEQLRGQLAARFANDKSVLTAAAVLHFTQAQLLTAPLLTTAALALPRANPSAVEDARAALQACVAELLLLRQSQLLAPGHWPALLDDAPALLQALQVAYPSGPG